MSPIYSLIAAVLLASVHVFSNALRLLDGVPRNRFLSIAGGMAVAFVILQLLPGLSAGQRAIAEAVPAPLGFLERHVYILVLLSLLVFYGLERLAKSSRRGQRIAGRLDATTPAVFWLHILTFAVMNVLIGYLLIRRHETLQALALFFTAMLLKFVVNDHGLHEDHKTAYDRVGRWILAGAVLLGWLVGFGFDPPAVTPAMLQAILAGAVLLNVFKEELPEERQGRLWAFALGALGYAVLLLAV